MSEATQFSISRALASTSAASEKAEGRPVSWLISANNVFRHSSRGTAPEIKTRKEARNSTVRSRKDTKKKTVLAQLLGIKTGKKTLLAEPDSLREQEGLGLAARGR